MGVVNGAILAVHAAGWMNMEGPNAVTVNWASGAKYLGISLAVGVALYVSQGGRKRA